MDTTKIILDTRLELLDYANDYTTYASKLTTRLRSTKKRLGIPGKSHGKPSNVDITPSQLSQNHEYVCAPPIFNGQHQKSDADSPPQIHPGPSPQGRTVLGQVHGVAFKRYHN